MAISAEGYIRPTYDELLAARLEQAMELFGDDVDTSNDSPLGKFIRLAVQDLADAYEAQEIIYYSRFPSTATGQSLDRLMPFAGITRNPATPAEHDVIFTGTAGYEIPVGFLVGTTTGIEFYLVNAVTLDGTGTGTGTVQCTELGTVGNVEQGAITEIINPDANVSGIEHDDIVTFGDAEETDADLRARFALAITGAGSGTLSAITGAVMRVAGVKSCVAVENAEDTTDAEGRPPHSFEVYVNAPEDLNQQVAEAIFEKKPVGIKSYGDISVSVLDASGVSQTVNFSRVSDLIVYIRMTVTTDATFELDGVAQIKAALMEYIDSLANGEDVIYTSLYKYIYSVTGVQDIPALAVSTDGSTYSTANIDVAMDEVAATAEAYIEVTVNAGS